MDESIARSQGIEFPLVGSSTPVIRAAGEARSLDHDAVLDFGDRFTDGELTVLEDDFDNTNINGPDLTSIAGATLTFNAFGDAVNVDFNGDGSTNATDDTTLRSSIVSLVQRAYEVFDVTVVNLTAAFQTINGHQVRAASSLADIETTLNVNDGGTEHNDSYVFVTGYSASAGVPHGFFGVAGGSDILSTNLDDDTAIVDVEEIVSYASGSFGVAPLDEAIGHTASHEAAHTFGLQHTFDNTADYELLGRSDIIRSQFDDTYRQFFSVFTRYDLSIGGGSTQNSYNELANDANIGLKANAPAYVTGTGAFDVITITRVNSTTANVSVQPHRTANHNDPIGSALTYTINYTNGIIVESAYGEDRVTVSGSLGVHVRMRGGHGGDVLDATAMTTGSTHMLGEEGNDWLLGSSGSDAMYGGLGDDHAYGRAGNDSLMGEAGNDSLYGEDGNDYAYGGAGNDVVYGGNNNDNLMGDAGNDILQGGAGDDSLSGGAGSDTYYFSGSSNLGTDSLSEASNSDTDILDFQGFGAAIYMDISLTGNRTIAAGLLVLNLSSSTGIENVRGTAFGDVLVGNSRDNFFQGFGGVDYLIGNDGNDVLEGGDGGDHAYGGNGNDILRGGLGADFLYGMTGADTIYAVTNASDSASTADGVDYLDVEFGVDSYFYRSGEDTVV